MLASVKASLGHCSPFHIFIKVRRSLASNFIELLLFPNALFVDLLPADDIIDIIISWGCRVTTQEVLHRLRVGNLGVVQKRANEGSKRDSLLLAPQDDILHILSVIIKIQSSKSTYLFLGPRDSQTPIGRRPRRHRS
jgi:hypothetical protein